MRWIVSFVLRLLRRGAFLFVFVVLILGSNILLLTADAVYDVAKRGLWSLASVVANVAPPTTHRGNREVRARLTAQTDVLDAELRRARNEVDELAAARVRLNSQIDTLDTRIARLNGRIIELEQLDRPTREIVSEINERLARRTSRMISTNLSSMAIEAVPYVGVAAIVGVTFMEVRDACMSLADTRELSRLLSGEPEAEIPACGYSPKEFWDILRGGPDPISCEDLSEDMPPELKIDCDFLPPGGPTPPNPDPSPEPEPVRRPGE